MDGKYSGTGAHLEYKVSLDRKTEAMQIFYVKETKDTAGTVTKRDIYALQRSGNDDYLSHCELNSNTGVYEQVDTMKLVNFGHGQLLQYFQHNGNDYFWVGTYASQDATQPFPWSQQIGRIQYKPGTSLDYKQTTRLTGLRYARKDKPAFKHAVRVEGALSSKRDKLLILVIDDSSPHREHFVLYDNEALNTVLDGVEGSTNPSISCNDGKVIKAALKDFVSDKVVSLSYDSSIEGVELADNDAVYFSSSAEGKNRIGISRSAWGSSSSIHKLVDNSNWTSGETEGEAIQLLGDNVLIGITQYPNGDGIGSPRNNSIYRFPKSAFN